MLTKEQLLKVLEKVNDPELGRNIVELGMVRDLTISPEGAVAFTLALTIPGCPMKSQMERDARLALMAVEGVSDVQITFAAMNDEERKKVLGSLQPQLPKLNEFNHVGKVIAVLSGKGGVGKSSVTALLANGLVKAGKKVGILDADITGPSIPRLFGLPAGGLKGSEQGILPAVTCSGIKVVSTNLMVPNENAAVIWRGPMIAGIIQQFWRDVLWGTLDVLLVDLPPGTSDAALTVMQSLPVNGVVLVTTPQQLAGMVVRKADAMLKQLNIPVLAVVENMSFFPCPDTGKSHYIFGESHVAELAEAVQAKLIVQMPIDPRVAEAGDAGKIEEIDPGSLLDITQLL
jgi:Mrp family chromosome partitioning ATPase